MTKQGIMLYEVEYLDDWNKKHITFVRTMDEVRFLKQRFERVVYSVTEKFFTD